MTHHVANSYKTYKTDLGSQFCDPAFSSSAVVSNVISTYSFCQPPPPPGPLYKLGINRYVCVPYCTLSAVESFYLSGRLASGVLIPPAAGSDDAVGGEWSLSATDRPSGECVSVGH